MSGELIFEIFIPMAPHGKQRPRVVRRKTKKGIIPIAITPDQTVSDEHLIRFHVGQAWKAAPLDEPLILTVTAYFDRPKSKPKKVVFPTGKPDWDNLGKLVCDSLNGLLWRDDSVIVDGGVRKRYCDADILQPGFHLTLWRA